MTYAELLQTYFERSNTLQWYWTIYVIIIGGLLAFSSLRQRPDTVTAVLVTVLFACFAYKNCSAIGEVTHQRHAVLAAMKQTSPATRPTPSLDTLDPARVRQLVEPTLQPPTYESVRNFHYACDLLTVAAFWAMEWRRRRLTRVATAPIAP